MGSFGNFDDNSLSNQNFSESYVNAVRKGKSCYQPIKPAIEPKKTATEAEKAAIEAANEAEKKATKVKRLEILANKIFFVEHPDVHCMDKIRPREEILEDVKAEIQRTLHVELGLKHVLQSNANLQRSMHFEISIRLLSLYYTILCRFICLLNRIAEAEAKGDQNAVREAHLASFLFCIRIADKEKALKQLEKTEEKTVGMGFFYKDFDLISKTITKAKNCPYNVGLIISTKDQLNVYEGLYYMSTGNFKEAANLFLGLIPTINTWAKLFSSNTFIFYTVLSSIVSLDRASLKQKVMDASRNLNVQVNTPYLLELMQSPYDCQYKSFFEALVSISEQIKLDRYLKPHYRDYMWEVRRVVYSQFLSVTLGEKMATAFGVTLEFIELDFIHRLGISRLHNATVYIGGYREDGTVLRVRVNKVGIKEIDKHSSSGETYYADIVAKDFEKDMTVDQVKNLGKEAQVDQDSHQVH
ncbi:hypothetical protein MKX01_018706 [Papaver californicum]|nr:hypothetical protein MKX01_018706 [Papaver californicum]